MESNEIPYFSENCSLQCTIYILSLYNSDNVTNLYDFANTFSNYLHL